MRVGRLVPLTALAAGVALAALGACSPTAITVAHRASAGRVATQAPAFRLPSHQGGELDSASLRGQRVALVFYRGFW
ncbi:MAG: hypothetical protein K8W52_41510 [Deltaproteobacteria bacterium]|nr:hypothetical protein [Deltaproteobacteria bacterium]